MSYLSKNIKYLRKLRRWNQTELADRLNVKRGSIASYESKNVEPRLSLIVNLAKLFDIRLVDLIEKDLSLSEGNYRPFHNDNMSNVAGNHANGDTISSLFAHLDESDYANFMDKSQRMQKMLDGFKVFYKMKLDSYREGNGELQFVAGDIENFILLLEQLSKTNEFIFKQTTRDSS